jgi:hypothetical protein
MKSEIRKIIEKFDSSANTFSMRVPELTMELYENAISGYVGVRNKFRDFLIHEKMIRNDELFWIMWGNAYIGTPQVHSFHEEIADALSRGTRLEIPLNKRIRLANQTNANMSGENIEQITKDLSMFISSHTAEEEVIIYRGFLVPEGAEIRVGRFMDDPSSHIQDEGIGFSFTFDKKVAIAHSIMNTSSALLLRLYGDELGDKSLRTWKEFSTAFRKLENSKKMLERTLKYTEYMKMCFSGELIKSKKKLFKPYESASEYIGFNVRPCIGKYSIKKDDVLCAFNYAKREKELFVNPSDASLLHYEFTSWKEQMKQWKENYSKSSLDGIVPNPLTPFIEDMQENESKGYSIDEQLKEVQGGNQKDEEYFKQIDPV